MEFTKVDLQRLLGADTPKDIIALVAMLPPASGKRGRAKVWTEDDLRPWLHDAVLAPKADLDELKAEKIKTEIRVNRLKGDKQRCELDLLRKRTLPADEVEAYGADLGAQMKQMLESLAPSLAVRLAAVSDANEVESIIEERVIGICKSIEEWRWDVAGFRERNKVTAAVDEEEDNEREEQDDE